MVEQNLSQWETILHNVFYVTSFLIVQDLEEESLEKYNVFSHWLRSSKHRPSIGMIQTG